MTEAARLESLDVMLCKATVCSRGELDVNGDENVVRKGRVNNTQVVKDEVSGSGEVCRIEARFLWVEKSMSCETVVLID